MAGQGGSATCETCETHNVNIMASSPPLPDSPQAATAATRLRLRPHKDRYSEPWRYFILLYLAHLLDVSDYEGRHFGPVETRVALEMLRNDLDDLLATLARRK